MSDREEMSNYVHDLGGLIKEKALEVRRRVNDVSGSGRSFELGRLSAYHDVVSLMQQQAVAFGLNLEDLSLDDIEPETDLV